MRSDYVNGTRRQKLRRKETDANSGLKMLMPNSRGRVISNKAIRNSQSLKRSRSNSHKDSVQWLTVGNASA